MADEIERLKQENAELNHDLDILLLRLCLENETTCAPETITVLNKYKDRTEALIKRALDD